MAVNRLASNSTNAGRMYTNDGIVCIVSRIGRRNIENRSLRAEHDPEDQPEREGDDRRDEDLDERLHRVLPEAHQEDEDEAGAGDDRLASPLAIRASPAATPTTSQNGRGREDGLERVDGRVADARPCRTRSVTAMWSRIQSTTVLTGSRNETWTLPGKSWRSGWMSAADDRHDA